jgi:hypothetical protein
MIDEVMFEVQEMTGQQYVHHYAGQEPTDLDERVDAAPIATVTDITPVVQVERKLVAVGGR